MRKFFNSLANLSLVQQLLSIIFIITLAFFMFITVYLRGSIDDFVLNQVMSILQRSQAAVVMELQTGTGGHSAIGFDNDIMHYVYYKDTMRTYYGSVIYQRDFLDTVDKTIKNCNEQWTESSFDYNGETFYYRELKVDKYTKVISIINESYGNSIESTLISSFTTTCTFVFSSLFIILLFWVMTLIVPLGQIRIYVEKVRRGDEKAELNVNRSDEIGDLAKALVSMREELKHQEETKEEMVHNISHDLKTPIATIKSYSEGIKDGIYPYGTLDKSIDVILDNAQRLEKKVYSLLFLNRLDFMSDQEKETDKISNMRKVCEEVLVSIQLIRPEIEIETHLEDSYFKGEDESWRVVVENLLDNALRYAANNVRLTLKDGHLSVYNDGSSISKERMEKLFKPFEKGTKGKFGLGLSICQKVCATYGYTISAQNTEDGVQFDIEVKNTSKKKFRK